MSTLLLHHPCFLNHLTPPGHPERPDRLRAIERALEAELFQPLIRENAPLGDIDAALLAHPAAHIDMIRDRVPTSGIIQLDADTSLSPGSWEAALRAIGAGCRAVDEVLSGNINNAFCAIRPPGHHAETAHAMGFCLFNTIAIAARHAQRIHGVNRVAIVDFDVHHGNGTQDIFWTDASVLYCSTHQMPLFPGTGASSETGVGNIVNAPLHAGDGSAEFREAMEIAILPRIELFQPELILVSAGFDAHFRDPLANINLVEADFAWITRKLMDLADKHCDGRLVSLLEGGYDLEGLSQSAAAHISTLMEA